MKHVLIIFLLLALVGQNFSKLIIVANYEINKEYIAQNLCENKALPALHCHGKCQLVKKLQADDQASKPASNNTVNKGVENETLFVQPLLSIHLQIHDLQVRNYHSNYLLKTYSSPITAIFHPPTV